MKQLGCWTPSGLIVGLITALVISGLTAAQGGVLFSPGPLNAQAGPPLGGVSSHAMIGGECRACHVAVWERETMDLRCLNCHQAIAVEQANPDSLHGAIYQPNPHISCRQCHTEHQGAQASLTTMTIQAFPHQVLGFSLAAHLQKSDGQPFECRDCHPQNLQTFDQAACQDCHQRMQATWMEQHVQDFGLRCLACHDGSDRFGRAFVHPSSFPLQGKHAGLACAACHPGVQSAAAFKLLTTACVSCHQEDDPHQGRFGSTCETCHSPQGWQTATFDHSRTAFPLSGKHQQVACQSCHPNGAFKGTPMDCRSCHGAQDVHEGQMPECETCHTTDGWQVVRFDHQQTAFPLIGAHLGVACHGCHPSLAFRGTPTECVACHRQDDAHQGRFGSNCAACHSPESWKPATFDHNLSGFPLSGAHARLPCERCHQGNNFSGLPTACAGCHREPTFHSGVFGSDCAACHSTQAWQPAKFPLPHPEPRVEEHGSGIQHGNASCRTCHPDTVHTFTCRACHSGNPEEEEEEGDED